MTKYHLTLILAIEFFAFTFHKNTHTQMYTKILINATKLGEHIQFGISTIVSCIAAHQIAAPKLLHSHFTVDICTVIQSIAVCVSLDCDAFFHLFGRWNAGERMTTLLHTIIHLVLFEKKEI